MPMVKLSGFGDEIAKDFEDQLREMRKMDINFIALRNLWGVNVLNLSVRQKLKARMLLRQYGMGLSEIATPLGKVLITDNWEEEWARYEKAIEMAHYFKCRRIRIFSYYFPGDEPSQKYRSEVIRRLKEMATRAERENLVLLHENEERIYGEDGIHVRDLMKSVDSGAFKVAFDPSNFVSIGSRPYTQWWDMLKDDVIHLHVKDKKLGGAQVPAGEGDGEFPAIMRALVDRGYIGFAVMEPHLAQAGQFTGFSGPRLFAQATDKFRALCDSVGMNHRQVRVGVIGAGFIGGFHATSMQAVPEAHLVAACDVVDSPKLGELRELYNIEVYTDPREMLKRKDVAAVTVCTPSGLHGKVAVQALRAGKHALTEKPMDIGLKKADEMIAIARAKGLKLGVISQHRTDPGIVELKEAVASGKLGQVILAEAYVKWYRSQEYYDSGGWRGTWKLDGGGALMNQGVHTVDMLQWIVDSPVESVFAQAATQTHKRIEVEDLAQALLRFKSGAMGSITASTSVYPGLPERIEITGTKGTMIVEKDKVIFREIAGEAKGASKGDEDDDYGVGAADPKAISNRGHITQIQDFCRAIIEDRDPLISGEEGRKPLEIILAVYESARLDKRVHLPMKG